MQQRKRRREGKEKEKERRIVNSLEAKTVRRMRNCVDARAMHEGSGLKPLKKATTIEEERRILLAPLVSSLPSGGFKI